MSVSNKNKVTEVLFKHLAKYKKINKVGIYHSLYNCNVKMIKSQEGEVCP
jgi:hypothetical protein